MGKVPVSRFSFHFFFFAYALGRLCVLVWYCCCPRAQHKLEKLQSLLEEKQALLRDRETQLNGAVTTFSPLVLVVGLIHEIFTPLWAVLMLTGAALNEEIAALQRQKQDLEEDLERYRAQEDRSQNRSGSEAAAVKRLDAKKQRLLERKSELVQSIIDVGGVQSNQEFCGP